MTTQHERDRGMDEHERYELICKPAIEELKRMIETTALQTADIHRAIFVGNGKPSIVVQLTEGREKMQAHEREIQEIWDKFRSIGNWLSGIAATLIGGVGISALVWIIFRR